MKKATVLKICKTLLPLPCGMIAALPLLIRSLAPLSFVLWIPFCFLLKKATSAEQVNIPKTVLCGLLFFQGYFMAAFSFFAAMYPMDFAGISPFEAVGVLSAAMLLLPLVQAIGLSIAVLLLALAAKGKLLRYPVSFSAFFAVLCVIFFYLQNFTWLGVPLALPANGLTSTPLLIQTASLFGSGFLNFLIFFCNALLAEAIFAFSRSEKKTSYITAMIAVALLFSNTAAGTLLLLKRPTPKSEIKVVLLQGNAPVTEDYYMNTVLYDCRTMALEAAKESPDVMLWSEAVLEYSMEKASEKQEFFASVAKETNAIQIVGAYSSFKDETGDRKYYNALFVFYPDGSMSEEVYYKRHPVPFGEFLPWEKFFDLALPALTEISLLSRGLDKGTDPNLFHTPQGTIGGLICFDSIYPASSRASVKDDAELLVLATNDSWFDGSHGKGLHYSHAILRAVENGRTVARTGNTGISAIIDANGIDHDTLPEDERTYLVGTCALYEHQTLYTKIGDLFVYLCAAFPPIYMLVLWIMHHRRQKRKSATK